VRSLPGSILSKLDNIIMFVEHIKFKSDFDKSQHSNMANWQSNVLSISSKFINSQMILYSTNINF
jgi:hypothetical protein